MRAVPFLDLPAAYAELREELDAVWARAASSGQFILGEEVAAFEAEFAAYCGAAHAVGVGSGLDALHLLLRGAGIGEGDEVVVPGHTFIATWLAVSQAGATPVPVDVDEASANLDPQLVERAIGPRTRAICAVHLYGRPAQMDALGEIAARRGVLLIEDAAQAHGAVGDGGRRAGALGHAAAFSFYPGKNLGALGDGGMVVTDDDALADRVRLLRSYGSRVKYEHELQGFNSRLDALQAGALRVKLRRLDDWNDRRRRAARRYHEGLGDLAGLSLPQTGDTDHVWHVYAVRHVRRDELQRELAQRGVPTISHYPVPVHRTEAYAGVFGAVALPVTELLAREVLSLPMGPHLTAEQQDVVIAAVREAAARIGA